ncbi:hypothetical protein DPEC_G00057100 [Dallia pectoralis]|uniref:Uncharacterized protein n=1 Tax=Dallia pectoralis TaxID=75939 RepID=A0ACC2H5S7_DALPE|nr:hypothetical protein DPEC_G00057100 [Dallia pectoralis]
MSQFSSTEDELDQVGLSDEEMEENREGSAGEIEELTAKLCRLARQVSATQFSSTEDELDRVGLCDTEEMGREREERGETKEGEKEEVDTQAMWVMGGDEEERTFKLRDLASLVSASQFSSTEDELDRVEEYEGEREEETKDRSERDGMDLPHGREEWVGDGRGEMTGVWNGTKWGEIDGERRGNMEGEIEGERSGNMEGEIDGERSEEMAGVRRRAELQGEKRWGEMEGEKRWGEREGERRWGEMEMVRKKRWYREVMMTAEGRMMSLERKDSIGELDARLFDFEDESDREEEPPYEAANQEGVTDVLRMTESIFKREENERPVEAKRKIGGAVGGGELERSDSVEALEGEETFDHVSNGLANVVGGVEVDMDGEMDEEMDGEVGMKEREEETSNIKETETVLRQDELVDEHLLDKMLMLEPLSDTEECFDKTGDKPEEEAGVGKEHRETENNRKTFGYTVDVALLRGRESFQETHKSPAPENLERKENVSDQKTNKTLEEMEEDPSVEKGVYDGWEVKDRKSGKESKVHGEREDEKNTVEEEKEAKENREPEESAPSGQEEIKSAAEIQNMYSAVSLRSITTEVLMVLNATEDLVQGMQGVDNDLSPPPTPTLHPSTDPKRLDQQLSRLEESVYVAASTAYGLEAELGDLEECARAVSGATPDLELSYLEEQVAWAAAQVHQSGLQVSDIAARITALKNAGLNIVPHNRFSKPRKEPKMKKPKPD